MGIKNVKYAISKRRSIFTHVLVPFFRFRRSQVSKTVEGSVFEGFKTMIKTPFSCLRVPITNLLSEILKFTIIPRIRIIRIIPRIQIIRIVKKWAYDVKHNEHMQFYTTDGGHSFSL